MTKLRDPNLPPGEIVEKRIDGIWVRNDGIELRSAEENPYYVMATVYGEPGANDNPSVKAKNLRIWNGWACEKMQPAERREIERQSNLHGINLSPLSAEEIEVAKSALRDRLDGLDNLPDPDFFDFRRTVFPDLFRFGNFVTPAPVAFSGSIFQGEAIFYHSFFRSYVDFQDCNFEGEASFELSDAKERLNFSRATFSSRVSFDGSHLEGGADFMNSEVAGRFSFVGVKCSGLLFDRSTLRGEADFLASEIASLKIGKATFARKTSFENVKFENVPEVSPQAFEDDVVFTTARDKDWPRAKKNPKAHYHRLDVPPNSRERNDYRNLRRIAAAQQNPENEHFFLRREMACSAELQDNPLSKWVIKGFGTLSDYGYSIGWPLLWLFVVWVLGSLLLQAGFAYHLYGGGALNSTFGEMGILASLGLGLSNTFAIFGFRTFYWGEAMVTLPATVKVVGGAQTVLGFIFLFFLGLGLRNRFRLK